MKSVLSTNESLDIRDIEPGETYYVITSLSDGGRCINNGLFRAAWRDKKQAVAIAKREGDNYRVVKCHKM